MIISFNCTTFVENQILQVVHVDGEASTFTSWVRIN